MSSRVEIYIDLSKLANPFADNISDGIAAKIRSNAKSRVRVASRDLQDSIISTRMGQGRFIVSAGGDGINYAWAQEKGLAKFGKPNYGYTPYMFPAQEYVMQRSVLEPIVIDAFNGAIDKARSRQSRGLPVR